MVRTGRLSCMHALSKIVYERAQLPNRFLKFSKFHQVDFGVNLKDFAFVNILAFADIISLPAGCMTGILAGLMEDTSIVNNADEIESRYWSVTPA